MFQDCGAWEEHSSRWWLTYGGVYNKCLKVEGYSNSSAHYYCQCMAKCFATNMNESTNKHKGDVEKIVNKCGVGECYRPLLQHIKATQDK